MQSRTVLARQGQCLNNIAVSNLHVVSTSQLLGWGGVTMGYHGIFPYPSVIETELGMQHWHQQTNIEYKT